MDYLWALWLGAAVLFFILELIKKSTVSMWTMLSSLITAVVSLFAESLYLQTAVFLILSVAFFFGLGFLYKRFLLKSEKAYLENNK